MFSLQILKTGKVYFTAVEFFSLYVNKQITSNRALTKKKQNFAETVYFENCSHFLRKKLKWILSVEISSVVYIFREIKKILNN